MRALWSDANVLLRFITGEPKDMAAKALLLMKDVENGKVVLRVPLLVVAEVVWVLCSYYEFPRTKVAEALVPLLAARGVEAESRETALGALVLMAERNVDFVDAVLAISARESGEAVVSFDRDFEKLSVTRVEPGS